MTLDGSYIDFDASGILYTGQSISGIKHQWSIVFETGMCDMLFNMGCAFVSEPPLKSNGRGDFLVTSPDGDEFYLEATVLCPEYLCITTPEMDACRKLNSMCRHPYYHFTAVLSGDLKEPLNRRELYRIADWVESLPYGSLEFSRQFTFASGVASVHDGQEWSITIYARPRAEYTIDDGVQFLSSVRRTQQANISGRLHNKIKDKRKQYKGSDLPLVLAVNDMLDKPIADGEMVKALFGWCQPVDGNMYRVSPPPGYYPHNPCWSASRNTTISAIALFRRWEPGSEFNVCLYDNPWARHPIPNWVKDIFPSAITHDQSNARIVQVPIERTFSAVC